MGGRGIKHLVGEFLMFLRAKIARLFLLGRGGGVIPPIMRYSVENLVLSPFYIFEALTEGNYDQQL